MALFKITANAKSWGGRDETMDVKASTPEQALTKARIVRGEDFYRRAYMVAAVINGARNHIYQELEIIPGLSSYGMVCEQMRRDYGRCWERN